MYSYLLSSTVKLILLQVQCDLRSLEEENLVPSNTQNGVVDAGDKVTFICKEGFAGNKAVYVCSSDGKLIPTGESADCKGNKIFQVILIFHLNFG